MPIRVCPRCNARYRDAAARCPHDGAPLEVRPDPLLGKVLGRRYRIVDELGSGGMGAVFRARHVVVGRDVAVKILSRDAGRDPVWRERFLREAQTTNLLKHDNIVDITDFGDEGGTVFLVMELLEGESLEQRLERGPLTALEAIEVALPVTAALARAHELDVVHRDVKPGNIFLAETSQGRRVKVLDFGIARARTDARLTDTGVLLGTPQYMSPEQSLGQAVGPASDLYALGVVLFEALAGRLPFLGNGAHLLVQHAHDAPPRLRDLAPEVPAALADIVARLLAKRPEDRYRDAHALIAALTAARPEAAALGTRPPRNSGLGRPTAPPDTADVALGAWRSRVASLEAAAAQAFPRGVPPPVAAEIDLLRRALDVLRAVSDEAHAVAVALDDADGRHRTTVLRIGGALDVLSRDASEVRAALDDARARLREAEAEARFRANLLAQGVPTPTDSNDPFAAATTPDVLAEMDRAARAAQARVEAARGEVRALENDADDLAFQIQALRGRMGAVQSDRAAARAEVDPRADDVALRLARAHDALGAAADRLALRIETAPDR